LKPAKVSPQDTIAWLVSDAVVAATHRLELISPMIAIGSHLFFIPLVGEASDDGADAKISSVSFGEVSLAFPGVGCVNFEVALDFRPSGCLDRLFARKLLLGIHLKAVNLNVVRERDSTGASLGLNFLFHANSLPLRICDAI
jgi:hypothetical protein